MWNRRRSATIEELLGPECVGHLESGDVHGIDAFKRFHAEFLGAFPDLHVSVEAVVGDGDEVVIRWRAAGCHSGNGLGFDATHQQVTLRGMTWHRYQDGKLVEGWDSWNHMATIHQLRVADQERREGGGKPM